MPRTTFDLTNTEPAASPWPDAVSPDPDVTVTAEAVSDDPTCRDCGRAASVVGRRNLWGMGRPLPLRNGRWIVASVTTDRAPLWWKCVDCYVAHVRPPPRPGTPDPKGGAS